MKRRHANLGVFGVGVLIFASVIAVLASGLEFTVARFFMKCSCPALTESFQVIANGGVATGYLLAAAFAAGIFRWLGRDPARTKEKKAELIRRSNQAAFIFVSIASLSLIIPPLKFVIGRSRPALYFSDGVHGYFHFTWDAYYWSMPSGHAAMAFALASALCILWPRYWYIYFGGAILVAASRVITNAHFLGDVMVAAGVAMFVPRLVARLFRYMGIRLGHTEVTPKK